VCRSCTLCSSWCVLAARRAMTWGCKRHTQAHRSCSAGKAAFVCCDSCTRRGVCWCWTWLLIIMSYGVVLMYCGWSKCRAPKSACLKLALGMSGVAGAGDEHAQPRPAQLLKRAGQYSCPCAPCKWLCSRIHVRGRLDSSTSRVWGAACEGSSFPAPPPWLTPRRWCAETKACPALTLLKQQDGSSALCAGGGACA
jgi:hypothetical protein